MSSFIEKPVLVSQKSATWFRHINKSDSLLCYLKGIKLVSTLNASIWLLRGAYAQEIGAMLRIADDCCSEMLFMNQPANAGQLSSDQKQFLNDFFQEEFGDIDDLLETRQKRETLPKRKMFAAFGKITGEALNPSDAQKIQTVIHGTFSGYIHGAYPHIMELYGESPTGFHLNGMPNTRREEEFLRQLIIYVHRALMASELLALKIRHHQVATDIHEHRTKFEKAFGLDIPFDPDALMRKIKKKP